MLYHVFLVLQHMSQKGRKASSAGQSVLPPLINTEQDRRFLTSLNQFIDAELRHVDSTDSQQRYTIYKAAFDKLINYVTAYKPLLTAIKAEYEDCVEAIVRGHREAHFMQDKLKAMASEPATIRNFQKRSDELQGKLHVIRGDNERLAARLRQLRAERSERERKEKEILEPAQRELKKDSRHIPGLNVNQETDIKFLGKELMRVDKELRELRNQQRTRFSDRASKISLKEQLTQRVNKRDQLVAQSTILKAKRHRLKIAVEAAQAYVKIQPPHQTIGDAILLALSRSHGNLDFEGGGSMTARHTPAPSSFEDDDPGKEKEAEMILEYIEKFNELFEDSKYEQAAIHAANSPKGILRTIETLNKFKDVKSKPGERSPLLAFCDAVMASVLALGVKPSETISNECVRCALSENRLDLLAHWIAQDRLTVSKQLGSMIQDACQCEFGRCLCESLSLAETIFTRAGEHREAALCLMKQGRVRYAIQYARQREAFGMHDYLALLQRYPTPTVAAMLHKERLLPVGQLVASLLRTPAFDIGLHLLQDLYERPKPDETAENPLRAAVFADRDTAESVWSEIISACQTAGHVDVAVELLAAMTVRTAVQQAIDEQKAEAVLVQQPPAAAEPEEKPARQVNIAAESSEEGEALQDNSIFDLMN